VQFCRPLRRTNPSSPVRQRQLPHGVLRRKVRLDFTVGSKRKQRMGIRRPISSQPCRATSWLMMCSSVMPCSGSRGWCVGDGIRQIA